jgi:GNAT superfamily N-acetyltransferase
MQRKQNTKDLVIARKPRDKVAGFRCSYRTSMSNYDDYARYLAVYEGDLFVFLDGEQEKDDREHPAGQVRLFVLNADAAEHDDESLFDVLDERGETAAYIPLLGDDAGNFARAVCKILGEEMVFCRNILILDRLEILPRFRGQQLGLQYVRAAIKRFGIGCRLAAIKPFPLQFEGKIGTIRGNDYVEPSKSMLADFNAATRKLKKYYAREGFVSLKNSDLMILDLNVAR